MWVGDKERSKKGERTNGGPLRVTPSPLLLFCSLFALLDAWLPALLYQLSASPSSPFSSPRYDKDERCESVVVVALSLTFIIYIIILYYYYLLIYSQYSL